VIGGRPLGGLQAGDPGQIGPFVIRARVGAGGTGVVYLAEAPDGTPVAVKVIASSVASDPAFGDRFRREVAAARRVRSPVTVAVLDGDPDADPAWIAFEYVEGPNLQDVVEAGVPRLSAAIDILTGIADALVAIHQVGIIHRDLKPSNVLCPPDGVKVIDFAIAAGGTAPAWLAPEQISDQPLTPAVDVFAWGCVAVYTLTGRLAFGGDDPATLVYRVVYGEPDLRGVPDELIEPVSAALAKRPEDRPAVSDLLRMLLPGRLRGGPDVAGAPVGALAPLLPLAAGVYAGGVATAGGADVPAPAPSSPPSPAVGPAVGPPAPSGAPAPADPPPPLSGSPLVGPPAPAAPPPVPPPGWVAPPPGPSGPTGPPPRKKRRVPLLVWLSATLLVLIVVLALIAGSRKNQSGSAPTTLATTAPATATVPPPASTNPAITTPAGITPLAQLLPSDVDASTGCSPNTTPPSLTGLSEALICSPKQLPGGQIFAFQFDNAADYTSSLAALNKFKGFDPTTAGSTCPPANDSEDATGWHNNTFPVQDGQILECLSVGTNDDQPDYIWTYPTDNAVIDAQGAANSSFTDLDNWWTKDAPPP